MTSILCLLLMGSALFDSQNPPIVSPPAVESFDGLSWDKVTFGKTTDSEIKKLYALDKGAIRPEALKLKLENENDRIDVILDGRGSKAKAMAIRYLKRYPKASIEDLQIQLQEKAVSYYQDRRWEDWSIAAFPQRGILVQVLKNGTHIILLCKPDRVKEMLNGFVTEPTDVVEVDDPGKDWDRVVGFGRVAADVRLGSSSLPNELDHRAISDFEWQSENSMRNATAKGTMRFDRDDSGRYEVDVHCDKFNSKGKGTVYCDAHFTSKSPYGPIDLSASNSEEISKDYRKSIQRLIDQTLNDLERSLRQLVNRLGPPAPETKRLNAEKDMLDIASRKEIERT